MSKVSTLRPAAGTGTIIIRTGKYNASSAPSSKPVMLARRPGQLLNFLCPGLTACEQRLIGAKMGQRPTLRSDGLWSISKISTNKPRWTRTGIRCSPWRNSHQSQIRARKEPSLRPFDIRFRSNGVRRRHDFPNCYKRDHHESVMRMPREIKHASFMIYSELPRVQLKEYHPQNSG